MPRRILFAAALSAALLFPARATDHEPTRAAIAEIVDAAVERYGLPGIAVGVVVDGDIRQTQTRGEAAAGSGQPITRDTLFKVASNTKAMTAALLARQVDAGLLAWDDPVVKHLPHFRMYEDWVTREMQVRDLLIHNSGLGSGAGDLMLWPEPNSFTREEVIAGLAHLKPRWSFRSRYAYDNTLYIVAGEVAAAVGEAPFDVLLRREVFEPLGMDGCRIGEWRVADAGPVAAPHARREGGWVARPDGEVVADMPMAAAGGVRCSLDDMLVWVQAWLDPDTTGADGAPWLSKAQREAAWTAHMPMPVTQRMRDWNRSHYSAYGHGWRLSDVDGTQKVAHTGTLSGMYSAVTLVPELGVGFVILINGEAGEARTVLEQALSKVFTSGAAADGRTGQPGAAAADMRAGVPAASGPGLVDHYAGLIAAERVPSTSPVASPATAPAPQAATAAPATAPAPQAATAAPAPAPAPQSATDGPATAPARQAADATELSRWLGRYRDPWFGEATVCETGGAVRFVSAKSPRLAGPVLRQGDRLLVDFDTLGSDADAWMEFSMGERGVARLAMAKVDPEADFSYDYEDLAFERVADCR